MNKKTIWITGGSTGIGKALAIKFASKGWNVAVSARREELLNEMPPFYFGGDMISEGSYETAKWNDLPYKFEAGTPNIADAIATGAAVDYLNSVGMDNIFEHEEDITKYALEKFKELDGYNIIGPTDEEARGGVISFTHNKIHPHDIFSRRHVRVLAQSVREQPRRGSNPYQRTLRLRDLSCI